MSILIQGMEMPQNCTECHARCRLYLNERKFRHPNCPLIEVKTPHGRLIDATFEENHYGSMLLDPTPDVTKEDKRNARVIIDALRMARTVIEAEGSEA